MGIGKRIKEAREALGLTQKELGDLVGVTGSSITNYENETSHPKEPILYKLFDALCVDANFLFQDCMHAKTPPISAQADTRGISLEDSNNLLVALGYINSGEQISDTDLAFLENIIGLLDAWFDKK